MAERWLGGLTGRKRGIISLSIRNLTIQSTSPLQNKSCTVMLLLHPRTVQPREHGKFQFGGRGSGEKDRADYVREGW